MWQKIFCAKNMNGKFATKLFKSQLNDNFPFPGEPNDSLKAKLAGKEEKLLIKMKNTRFSILKIKRAERRSKEISSLLCYPNFKYTYILSNYCCKPNPLLKCESNFVRPCEGNPVKLSLLKIVSIKF